MKWIGLNPNRGVTPCFGNRKKESTKRNILSAGRIAEMVK